MASSTKKRGQTMTLFLLLGVVLIAVVGFMLFLRGGMEGTGVEDAADLGLSTTSFKAHAHRCLKQEVLNAVDKYGVIDGQESYIGAYVRRNLPKCIEWDFYEEQGFAITAGKPEVKVEIAPDTLLVDVEYPLEGEDERGAFSFEELYYYLPRGSTGQLAFDGKERTKEEVSVSSSDGDAELVIPEGTVVKDADGNLVEEVKLRVLERDFNGLANPLIVGMVAYEITPHVTFSQPVTLKMTYREQDIPSGVAESTLRLAQFERNYNMWFSVPTTVNEAKNTLTASFTHFSPVAPVVRCGEDTYSEFPARYSWGAFIMNCNVGGSAGYVTWATDGGKDLFEDQAQDIGEFIFIPSERAEEGEEPVWSLEGQATPPTNDQVSLSPCTINDWDRDDRIDTVDQVTTECVHVTYREGEGAQPIEAVEELEAGECADANLQAILESCQSFVNEESIGRQDAFKQQEELAGRDIPTQDGIKDHESFEEETVSGCFRQIDESGNSVVGGGNWNPATTNTYGYRAVEGIGEPRDLPGGFAILEFRFAGNGGACVARGDDGKPMIELEVSSPSGDNYDFRINPYTGTTEDPELLALTPADSGTAAAVQAWLPDNWAGYKGTLEAKDFEVYSKVDGMHFINKVYIRMDNANEDGAVIAQVDRFVIHGTGVTFDVPHSYERCTVTVQDRINYLCGCDRNCNTRQGLVEGEDDWRADSELSIMAEWRGVWSLEDGSVVNGQTLLCDLDMRDYHMAPLRGRGWTAFGGYCGDDGNPVGMEPVVTGGECTTAGISACDYATNSAVECVELAPGSASAGTPESAASWQVRADGECGEDRVCIIMGGGATCVGEALPAEPPSGACNPATAEDWIDPVGRQCYRCMEVDLPGGRTEGGWGPLSESACSVLLSAAEVCVSPRACKSTLDCGAGKAWVPVTGTDADAANGECGGATPVCCVLATEQDECQEAGGECMPRAACKLIWEGPSGQGAPQTVQDGGYCDEWELGICCKMEEPVPSTCPPDSTYSEARASCPDLGEFSCSRVEENEVSMVCCESSPSVGSLYAKTCTTGTTCGADGRCAEGAESGVCPTIERCEDLQRPTGMQWVNEGGSCAQSACWPTYCKSNNCNLECTNYGDYCVPENIYESLVNDEACPPDENVGKAGMDGEVSFDGTTCWRCADYTPQGLGTIACLFNPSLCRMAWRRLSSTEQCGCTEWGRTYRARETAWFGANDCRECAGMDVWSAAATCSDACTISTFYGENLAVDPGQFRCIGSEPTTGQTYIQGCQVGSDGRLEPMARQRCMMGCAAESVVNPSSCTCPSSGCPACPATADLPPGTDGQLHWLEGSEYPCQRCSDGRWTTDLEGCWCDPSMPPGERGQRDGDWVWKDGSCHRCVMVGGTEMGWEDHPANDCVESRCSYTASGGETIGVPYNSFVCIRSAQDPNLQDIKRCRGENSFENPRSCPSGCREGGIIAQETSCSGG